MTILLRIRLRAPAKVTLFQRAMFVAAVPVSALVRYSAEIA
jgi:hypothetical protein